MIRLISLVLLKSYGHVISGKSTELGNNHSEITYCL